MRTLICPKCGNYLEKGEFVCGRCGTAVLSDAPRTPAPARRVTAEEEPQVICPVCGSSESTSLSYCSHCGTSLSSLAPTPMFTKKRSRLGMWLSFAAVAIAVGIGLLFLKNRSFSEGPRGAITLDSRSLPAETTEATGETGSAAITQAEAEELLQRTYGCTVKLQEQTAGGFTFTCLKGEKVQHAVGTVHVDADGTIQVLSGMQSIISRVDPQRLEKLIADAGSKTRIAVAVVDLTTGEFTGSEAMHEQLSSSVLIDLPILYTVAQKVADGSLTMDASVPVITGSGGRGSLNAFKGKSLTVSEVLQYVFLYSSNDATNSMIEFLGKDAVNDYCHKAGYTSVKVSNRIGKTQANTDNDNYVSAADLCGMLDELYNGDNPAINRDFLQHNLSLAGSDKTANKGLSKQLSGALIGSFNGYTDKKYNEIVWVEYSDCAYAMAFLANGTGADKLRRIASDLGAYIDEALRTAPETAPAATLPAD